MKYKLPRTAAILSAVLLLTASGCKKNSGSSSPATWPNNTYLHPASSAPSPAPTDSKGFPKLTEPEKEEVRSILLDGQCILYLAGDRGFRVYPDRHMEATIIITCVAPTFQQTTVVVADWRNPSTGLWEAVGSFVSAEHPAGGNVDNDYTAHVRDDCVKGVYTVLIHITGIGQDKHTPYTTGISGVRGPAFLTDCTPNVDAEGNPLK